MAKTIVIADDHEVVRTGIIAMLKGTAVKVIGEAATSDEAVSLTISMNPRILLLDVAMGRDDGFSVLERIRTQAPAVRTVVFSVHNDPSYVSRAIGLGAAEYIFKGCSRSELVDAIERVCTGGISVTSDISHYAKAFVSKVRVRTEAPCLTDREMQVVKHVSLGRTNREIAVALGISVDTVKEHVQNILRKINASTRTQIAVWVVKKEFEI